MSNTQTIDQSQSGRSRAYKRLTPESAVLVLIDHQSGLVAGIRDLAPDEVRHNVGAFARAAHVLGVPVVLTSTAPMMWGPTLPELTAALPGVENIERSVVNAWDEPRVREAVTRTGRQQLLIGGTLRTSAWHSPPWPRWRTAMTCMPCWMLRARGAICSNARRSIKCGRRASR